MAVDKDFNPVTDYPETNGMKYDLRSHRYVLTQDCILDEFADNLDVLTGSSDAAKALLKEISRQVYRYMYSKLLNRTRGLLEYLIAKDIDKAEALREALLEQYRYARVSGGNLISHQSGINTETGTIISADSIREMQVSESVKITLDTLGLLNKRINYYLDPNLYHDGTY